MACLCYTFASKIYYKTIFNYEIRL